MFGKRSMPRGRLESALYAPWLPALMKLFLGSLLADRSFISAYSVDGVDAGFLQDVFDIASPRLPTDTNTCNVGTLKIDNVDVRVLHDV